MAHINLQMVSLLAEFDVRKVAALLIKKKMAESDARDILSRLCIETDDDPLLVLSDILSVIINTMGEMQATCTVKDVQCLRQFFMGVLLWSPKTVMEDASLEDLADAFIGYCKFNGIALHEVVSANFLKEMISKFPDN